MVIITTSTFFEKPQTAPTMTPMVILMVAQMKARDMEMREPYHMASKVDSPEPPVPRMYFRETPYFAIAAAGVRCFISAFMTLA